MTIIQSGQLAKASHQQLQEALRLGLTVVTELWFYATGDWVTSVHAGDIDGDGDIEVLIGSRDGSVRALTKTSALKWMQTEESDIWLGAVYGIPNVHAADRTRVVVGSRNSKVSALDETGRVLWTQKVGQAVRRIRIMDINEDGRNEVIIGSEDCSIYVYACDTGQLLWKYTSNGWIRSIVIADFDDDGKLELLASSGDKHLYMLDCDGNLKKRYYAGSKVHSLFTADLDQDGTPEILVGSDAKDLYAMKPDGTILWTFHPANRIHSIHAVDLNNNGHLEVIAASEDEHIYILDHQGNLLWKHFLGHRIFSIYSSDINQDGLREILVGAEDNNVHVLRVELVDGLLQKIRDYHHDLGQPHSWILPFSFTERALLSDLIAENTGYEQGATIAEAERLLAKQDHFAALDILCKLEESHVQVLWTRDVGHIRDIALKDAESSSATQIVVGTDEGDVKLLDLAGNTFWSYSLHERIRSLEVADVDQDGRTEFIMGCTDGRVYALDNVEEPLRWQTQFGNWIDGICTTNSGAGTAPEMVFCTADNKIHIYSGALAPIIEPITTPLSVEIVQAYDLDGDGTQEIIAGAKDNNVYAYRRNGEKLWSFQTMDRVKAIYIYDIDHDGRVEVLVGSEDRNVYVLDNTGNLKWCYNTSHRVLDIDARDIDQDGNVEVLVGAGNGLLYVLNSTGDVLWQFKANDRIRVVYVADVNQDGKTELLLGSEDRLYLLQIVDRRQIHTLIEQAWQELLIQKPEDDLLQQFSGRPESLLRALALKKLAQRHDLSPQNQATLNRLINDNAPEVKKAFASVIVPLCTNHPQNIRTLLEKLSTDPHFETRMTFIDNLTGLSEQYPHLVFEYLDRFFRHTNKWIRRLVIRKLDQLVLDYPGEVFTRLLYALQNDLPWVSEEAARGLAHYFDAHTDSLLKGCRLIITREINSALLQVIVDCARKPLVQHVFRAFIGLLSEFSDSEVLEKLHTTVDTLESTRALHYGELTYLIYFEFYRLHRIRTIDELAQHRFTLDHTTLHHHPESIEEDMRLHFDGVIRVFEQLHEVVTIVRTYLRREGLGDRLASLLEANTAIDRITTEMTRKHFSWCKHQDQFPDCHILKLLMARWHTIVTSELGRLRGKAELRPELQTKQVQMEQAVGIILSVHNTGKSPADHVTVSLLPDTAFTPLGPGELRFETIPTHEPILAEFTIQPHQDTLHLAFTIAYDDAESREKVMPFGDRLELVEQQREFKRIDNPYYPGTPVQKQSMFYGREEELAFMQEKFVYSLANTVVVLYGQRRSGKSSLLYQLLQSSILDPHVPIRIDMQHETLNFSTSRFLHALANYIFREMKKRGFILPTPQRDAFLEDATFALDTFLDEVETVLQERKLIILIDEFEILEEKVKKNELDPDIFVYLRSLMQDRGNIDFLLAGTHTIKELTAEYWAVFFNIAIHHRISKLSAEAAQQLIIKPLEGILEYDKFAIEKISRLTGDQPYLIQLICHSLVHHCNTSCKNYVTINDVNTVQEVVMETGSIYFNWIWGQASKEERTILAILAQEGGDEGRDISLADIERVYLDYYLPYRRESVIAALKNLRDGDVIAEGSRENRYKIPVGLTRLWLRQEKQLSRVMIEENLVEDIVR